MASDIRKVGVVGIGLMGSGIAQVAAAKNFDTVVVDVSAEIIAKSSYWNAFQKLANFRHSSASQAQRCSAIHAFALADQ